MSDEGRPEADGAERERLRELLNGYWRTQMVCAAVEVGVVDELADGPCEVRVLAARTGVPEDRLGRLLRVLEGFSLVTRLEDGRFASSSAGRWLERDRPDGLYASAQIVRRLWYPGWSELTTALRSDRSAIEAAVGSPLFDHLADRPDLAVIFDAAMAESTRVTVDELAAAYDASWARTIVDVGGGTGALLAGLLDRYPAARGVLLETAAVASRARTTLDARGLATRCEVRTGDFFAEVPEGGDLYVLAWIVHDWADDAVITLLRNCRRAMGPGARLLVVEAVLPPVPEPSTRTLYDLHMLAVVGGQERTEAEFDRLFAHAGLERVATMATTGMRAVLELKAAGSSIR